MDQPAAEWKSMSDEEFTGFKSTGERMEDIPIVLSLVECKAEEFKE